MKNIIGLGLSILLVTGCSSSGPRQSKDMARYDAAEKAYKNAELSEAETRYTELVRKNPEYAEGWFKLGNIYVRTGQYDAAANMYKKAAQINPEDAKVWNNLALAYIKKAVSVLEEGSEHVQQSSSDQRNLTELRERIVQSVITEK